MGIRQLTRDEARRAIVRAQLLDADRPGDVVEVAEQLGYIKIDPTAVIAPAEHTILWSRIGYASEPGQLTKAVERDRLLFEFDGAFRPVSLLPSLLPAMRRWPHRESTRQWLEANDAFRRDVLARLRADGPLFAADIPDTAQVTRAPDGWSGSNQVPIMLDFLSRQGLVAIVGREGRRRRWDLAERVYPSNLPELHDDEAAQHADERRLQAAGIAKQKSPWTPVGAAGEPITIEGLSAKYRIDPAALAALDDDAGGRVAFLNPYDPMLFDRPRLREVFDFDYVLEQFKPKPQRRYGPFGHPIVLGDRFVGMLEAEFDRAEGVLRVQAVHEFVPLDPEELDMIRAEISELSGWASPLSRAAAEAPSQEQGGSAGDDGETERHEPRDGCRGDPCRTTLRRQSVLRPAAPHHQDAPAGRSTAVDLQGTHRAEEISRRDMGAHRSARTRTAARDRSNALTVAAADPGREHDSITADAVRSRPRKVTSTWVDPVAPREQPAHVPPAGQDAKHNRESIMSRTPSETLCELFVEQVPVAGASITVFRRPGAQSTIGSSDALSARLDQLQFDLGEGPRWETARTGLPSVSEDVGRDAHPEWPIFGAAAAELGVGALFSFPIRIGTQLLGVADLYRDAAGALGGEATARALTVSHQVAVPAVDAASRSADSAREAPTAGVELRREVHQAVGMALMQMDIASAEAFAVLRAYAFSHGSSLDAVAREVLSRRLDFSTHPIESTEES